MRHEDFQSMIQGWGTFDSIVATAARGVSEEDQIAIREAGGTAADVAALWKMCCDLVISAPEIAPDAGFSESDALFAHRLRSLPR